MSDEAADQTEAPEAARGPRPGARAAAVIAVLCNIVPLIGVLFWGWDAFAVIFLYWMENLVIGARTIVSMLEAGLVERRRAGAGVAAIALSLFFTLHYGLFCMGHGTFVFGAFGGPDGAPSPGMNPAEFVAAIAFMLHEQPRLGVGLAAIIVWQAAQFCLWALRGEGRKADLMQLMYAPYPRIVVLHMTIIFAGFMLVMFDAPAVGAVVLVAIKTLVDVGDALSGPIDMGAVQRWSARQDEIEAPFHEQRRVRVFQRVIPIRRLVIRTPARPE